MRMRAVVLVICAACGANSGAKPPDAAIDGAATDAPPTGSGPHFHFVMDHEMVPTNNTQARADGLDLDGNGTVDNQLGMVLATLSGMGFATQASVDKSVDTGTTLMLVDVQTTDFTNATDTGFTTYFGANPNPPACASGSDTVCRHHLTGTASFDVAASSPRDPQLIGSAMVGFFTEGPGHAGLQLAPFGANPIVLRLIGARARVSGVSATGITMGVLAGAVTVTDLNTMVIPGLQQGFVPIIQRDCCGLATSPGGATCNPMGNPVCGCTPGSSGATLLGLFDGDLGGDPKDCMVSVAEIQNNSLIQSLLAPDVTIEGQQALSLGIGFTAVGAMYTP